MDNEFNFILDGADESLCQHFDDQIPWIKVNKDVSIHDILVHLGVFKSKSQSKKNWQHGELKKNHFNWYRRVGFRRFDIVVRT